MNTTHPGTKSVPNGLLQRDLPRSLDLTRHPVAASASECISGHWQQARDFLRDLVAVNSYTLNPDGARENARRILRQFAPMAFAQTWLPSRLEGAAEHLILDSGGNGPAILLISHLDTVYPPEEQAAGYAGWDENCDRIVGPGTFDIKGGTVAMWLMVQVLYELHPELFSRFRWILAWNAAEEQLMGDFSDAVISLIEMEALACLVFEGDNQSQEGCEILTSRSGMGSYRISVSGRTSHSGSGHMQGLNAIVRLSELVRDITVLTDYSRNTTVNVGVIRGGETTNRVPSFAEALFEVRYRDPSHYAEIKAALMAFSEPGNLDGDSEGSRCRVLVEVLSEISNWPRSVEGGDLADFWLRAGQLCGTSVTLGCRSGLSDANYFSARVRTVDGLGPRGGNPHSVVKNGSCVQITEFVDQKSLLTKTLVNTMAVLELLETADQSGSQSPCRADAHDFGEQTVLRGAVGGRVVNGEKVKRGLGAFTLIELLVVIAIIATLATLLFTSLKAVKASANSAKCMANLRQIGNAMRLYIDDNEGWGPPQYAWTPFGTVAWTGQLSPYLGATNYGGALSRIFDCPSDPALATWPMNRDYTNPATLGMVSYGYNYDYFSPVPGQDGINTRTVSRPASVILVADIDFATGKDPLIFWQSAAMRPSQRHSKGYNALFLDGHVQWMDYSSTAASSTYWVPIR